MSKILILMLIMGFVFGLTGCIDGDGNRPPNTPSITCLGETEVGEEIEIVVQSTDPDRDRISYKMAFGDGAESEWSDYFPSGQSTIFTHIYIQTGDFEVRAIASDTHHDNSGWSDPVTIKVLPRPPPPRVFSWNGFKGVMAYGDQVNPAEAKAAGFNSIVCYNPPATVAILDQALAEGIWILPWLGHYLQHTEDLAACIDYVRAYKDHPVIGAWYFMDEPELFDGCTKENQIEWYNAVKTEDPDRDIYSAFTQNPNWPNRHFEPAAFDHASCTIYPLHQEIIDAYGSWQRAMDNYCANFNSHVENIPAGVAAQGWYNPPKGWLNPTGLIDKMLVKFQEHDLGLQEQGYLIYIWYDGSCIGLSQDAALLAHMKAVNDSYDWPHAPPSQE